METSIKLLHERIVPSVGLFNKTSYIVLYFENKEVYNNYKLGQEYDLYWDGEDTPHIMLYTISTDMYDYKTKTLDSGISYFDVIQLEEDYDNDILHRECGRHKTLGNAFDSLDRMFEIYPVADEDSCFYGVFNVAYDVSDFLKYFENLLFSTLVVKHVTGSYNFLENIYRSATAFFIDIIEEQVQTIVPSYKSCVLDLSSRYYFINELIFALCSYKSNNFLDLLRVAVIDNDFAVSTDTLYKLEVVDNDSLKQGFDTLFSKNTSKYSIYSDYNPFLVLKSDFVVDGASLFLARELNNVININFVCGLMHLISHKGFIDGGGMSVRNKPDVRYIKSKFNWTEIFNNAHTLQPLYCDEKVFDKLIPYIKYSWSVHLLRNGHVKHGANGSCVSHISVNLSKTKDVVELIYSMDESEK